MSDQVQQFSPRARGCSALESKRVYSPRVFPACAGMFRLLMFMENSIEGFPRVRGDVPDDERSICTNVVFSPRARGCSCALEEGKAEGYVFPACAGMFQEGSVIVVTSVLFSPRARGCSQGVKGTKDMMKVFPACAGMFLNL